MNSKKGNVFTIEALLGALLFIVALAAMGSMQAGSSWEGASAAKANDALVVLNKMGTLKTLDPGTIAYETERIFGNSSAFRMDIATYEYSNGAFTQAGNLSIGDSLPQGKAIAPSETRFFSEENGSISNYSIARLYVWK